MDNTCGFCGQNIETLDVDLCGPRENGKECLCCGRVVVAQQDQPSSISSQSLPLD